MPGAFAHLTLVNLLRSGETMGNAELPDDIKLAAMQYGRFVDLGSVSPDYPYLALSESEQSEWADAMHLSHGNGQFIFNILSQTRALSGGQRQRALAWCLGYVAHVVMDMTIHPVVELRVGPYEGNESAHRRCEMFQDVHIFKRLNLGSLETAEYLKSGIAKCSEDGDDDYIDAEIRRIWSEGLISAFPNISDSIGEPSIDTWHDEFVTLIDKIATEGNTWGMIPFARHVGRKYDVIYCEPGELESEEALSFFRDLETPDDTMHYDQVFDIAFTNVLAAWAIVGSFIVEETDDAVQFFGDWNLDNGKDMGTGRHVYW